MVDGQSEWIIELWFWRGLFSNSLQNHITELRADGFSFFLGIIWRVQPRFRYLVVSIWKGLMVAVSVASPEEVRVGLSSVSGGYSLGTCGQCWQRSCDLAGKHEISHTTASSSREISYTTTSSSRSMSACLVSSSLSALLKKPTCLLSCKSAAPRPFSEASPCRVISFFESK